MLYRLHYVLALAHPRILIFLSAGWIAILFSGRGLRAEQIPGAYSPSSLTAIVLELRTALQISVQIDIELVEQNDYLLSVNRHPQNAAHYIISCERGFLHLLTVTEIRAAIAHELGHVWIFNHHPYLQTEDLANSIAAKVVDPADLKQVNFKTQSYLTTKRLGR